MFSCVFVSAVFHGPVPQWGAGDCVLSGWEGVGLGHRHRREEGE